MGPRAVSNSLWEVYLEAKAQMSTEQDEKYLEALGNLVRAFEDDCLSLIQSILEKECPATISNDAALDEVPRYNETEVDSCRFQNPKSSKPSSLT